MIGRMFFLVAMLMLLSSGALAQGVPIGSGIYACDGVAQAGPCQPDADDAPVAAPPVRWQDRWGAIAVSKDSVVGVSTDENNKRGAQKIAIADCESRGGAGCDVQIAYYNQCAALVVSGRSYSVAREETEEKAIRSAVNDCNARNGRGACRVYYSGCSLPVRVQ